MACGKVGERKLMYSRWSHGYDLRCIWYDACLGLHFHSLLPKSNVWRWRNGGENFTLKSPELFRKLSSRIKLCSITAYKRNAERASIILPNLRLYPQGQNAKQCISICDAADFLGYFRALVNMIPLNVCDFSSLFESTSIKFTHL